ncbi:tRNA (adenosine(37)-N6)-dimethylallyltransferase MiaA [Thermogemmatispora carboxidivorans]|uniref:tRNA (adenosine(37)-N6)-dimethylallyltransferase MiaA n=1 Tax=Thermogemmatispora carboxidivorans TaxID=1382306 RepID=UPI0009DDF5AB|nr:tRNA (adenosine(37)-N6)-dimethylallyltransferase MiaA [Thermogemmatispora carboxidivorans]
MRSAESEQSGRKGKVVVVLGPTASGKSALGIQLAQRFNGEIVSADSRQVYRGLDLGTAKVTPEERALVPHHLLDVADPDEVYSAARFREKALAAIEAIASRGKLPLLVGGSPHYIQLVVDNVQVPQVPPDMELRRRLEQRPLADLVAELERRDPRAAARIDRRNARRVIRALEVCLLTGRPFSEQQGAPAPLYESLLLGIHWPRAELYRRIDQRVDERLRQGMVDEVRRLLAQGLSHERLEALGLEYRFIGRLLRGEYENEAEMAAQLKHAIHDFARRQLSWFRRDQRILWLEGPDLERAAAEVERFLEESH